MMALATPTIRANTAEVIGVVLTLVLVVGIMVGMAKGITTKKRRKRKVMMIEGGVGGGGVEVAVGGETHRRHRHIETNIRKVRKMANLAVAVVAAVVSGRRRDREEEGRLTLRFERSL